MNSNGYTLAVPSFLLVCDVFLALDVDLVLASLGFFDTIFWVLVVVVPLFSFRDACDIGLPVDDIWLLCRPGNDWKIFSSHNNQTMNTINEND